MTNIININSRELETIDSREIAKQTEELHKNVLRKIGSMIVYLEPSSKLSSADYFIESSYKDKNGQSRPCYLLTKLGCEMYVNKLSGMKGTLFTAFYVKRFDEMEKQIQSPFGKFANMIPTNMTEALQLALDQQKQLEKQKPKVDYYDEAMDNPALMTVTEIALHYGLSARKLNEFLEAKGVIYKEGNIWVLHQKYKGKGYADYKPFNDVKNGHRVSNNLLKWTQRGAKFIHDLLEENGIIGTLRQMDLSLELNQIRKEQNND